ncbi:MAG TPA: ATP-binding cassette domain-containing protein [Dehalococcoidia bacterium]|nr:ATP-binding cassette domain-containing protein [Dehalococcoidia bacterium]
MIEVRNLSKRYGDTLAVDQLTFDVQPGMVTGFLGPNGAGKSTTMRLILGLDAPASGSATINGRAYRHIPAPWQEVGSLLDAKAIQGGRDAYHHLLWIAEAAGVRRARVGEVLEMVGLADVASRKVDGFSLGMSQRLGIATALLGDPGTLLFDEPVNGLDPEGIIWVRRLLKRLASEGRTIFVSSHLMSEMQDTADHVVVIGRGRLIADMAVQEFIQHSTSSHVRVVSPAAEALGGLLEGQGATVARDGKDVLAVTKMDAAQVGEIAAANRIVLHELSPQGANLEEAFIELTQGSVEYQAGGNATAAAAASSEGTS